MCYKIQEKTIIIASKTKCKKLNYALLHPNKFVVVHSIKIKNNSFIKYWYETKCTISPLYGSILENLIEMEYWEEGEQKQSGGRMYTDNAFWFKQELIEKSCLIQKKETADTNKLFEMCIRDRSGGGAR